eukprot:2715675-Alexandrium_andersonii.AAC.1
MMRKPRLHDNTSSLAVLPAASSSQRHGSPSTVIPQCMSESRHSAQNIEHAGRSLERTLSLQVPRWFPGTGVHRKRPTSPQA